MVGQKIIKNSENLQADLKLPVNTIEVLKRRYLLKDRHQDIIETPDEMFQRVARHIA
jgi:ribonucleoside-diphosphate reductase alpha chain